MDVETIPDQQKWNFCYQKLSRAVWKRTHHPTRPRMCRRSHEHTNSALDGRSGHGDLFVLHWANAGD